MYCRLCFSIGHTIEYELEVHVSCVKLFIFPIVLKSDPRPAIPKYASLYYTVLDWTGLERFAARNNVSFIIIE